MVRCSWRQRLQLFQILIKVPVGKQGPVEGHPPVSSLPWEIRKSLNEMEGKTDYEWGLNVVCSMVFSCIISIAT